MDSKSIIITQGTEFLQLQDGVDIGQQSLKQKVLSFKSLKY